MSYVVKRMRPRYRVEATKLCYGTKEKAYRLAARRVIASEFDTLGWSGDDPYDPDNTSPALNAFRRKWCYYDDESGRHFTTGKYKVHLQEVVRRLMEEDASLHDAPEKGIVTNTETSAKTQKGKENG